MDTYEKLLERMCGCLISAQITDGDDRGAFRCAACGKTHGRADNAVFPMAYMYARTGEKKYTECIRELLLFQSGLSDGTGAVINDKGNGWRGITVFSGIRLYQTLRYFGDALPESIKNELEKRLAGMGGWVYENIRPGFRANINYYCAAAFLNAACGEYFSDDKYTAAARELLDYCMGLFTENGLIAGEGQPHGSRTEKGCIPFDAGYCAEESYPCLAGAARLLGDTAALKKLAGYAVSFSALILPDGGIDNSFGSRNNKWTYYGSRTSDGLAAGFLILSACAPELREAAVRNTELMKSCFDGSGLYGGRMYREYGQPACVHHLFCRAAGLADALCEGLGQLSLPPETGTAGFSAGYLPETDTYIINAGPWRATVTGYDFRTYTYDRGAAHASGGSMPLLYHRKSGAVIAGSVFEYKLTEPNNMQEPVGNIAVGSLIPRLEYEKDGTVYTTCLDPRAVITAESSGDSVTVRAVSRFVRVSDNRPEDETLTALAEYRFTEEKTELSFSLNKEKNSVRLILPLVRGTARADSDMPCAAREIFCPAGGFGAEEYTYSLQKGVNKVCVYPVCPLHGRHTN